MLSKSVVYFAVALCLLQVTTAALNPLLYENIKYDLSRKYAGVEMDVTKGFRETKQKIFKESVKLLKKARTPVAVSCIEESRLKYQTELDSVMEQFSYCMQGLNVNEELRPELTQQQVLSLVQTFKVKLNVCKQTAKMDAKSIQNSFQASGKMCLI